MIEIRNSRGETLQLPPDEKLTLEINGTILADADVLPGSYSYPFTLPLNENNRKFLDNGHLPERLLTPEMEVDVKLGMAWSRAKLTYKVKAGSANASLIIDLGAIANVLRNTSIREFVSEEFFIGTVEGIEPPTLLALSHADPGVYPIVCPPFLNSEMVEEDFEPTAGYVRPEIVNLFFPDVGVQVHMSYGDGSKLIVPMVYVGWLLRYIANKFGFSAEGTFFKDSDLIRLIIFNTQTIAGNQGRYTVKVGRHLPDVTVGSFLKAIRGYVGMSIDVYVADRKVIFNTYNSYIKTTAFRDISPNLVAGTQGLEKVGSGACKVKTSLDSADEYLKEDITLDSYVVGKAEDVAEVQLEVGTTKMHLVDITTDAAGAKWLLPRVQQAGNLADPFFEASDNYSPYIKANEPEVVPDLTNAFGLRCLLYWGMRDDTAGRKYPYASSVSYDSRYRVFARLSLFPGEPDDVWYRYQQAYYEFLTLSLRVDCMLRLPLWQLSMISASEKLGIRFDNFALGLYLMEKLTYELPEKEGHVLAKLECRQLIPNQIKGNQPEDQLYIGYWVQIVIENWSGEIGKPDLSIDRTGDVVMYVWNDGEYTLPAADSNLIVNYKTETLTTTLTGVKETIFRSHEARALAHRTVLFQNILIMNYKYVFPFPTFEYLYRIQFHAFAGKDYRLRQ